MKKYLLISFLLIAAIHMVCGETPRVEPSFWWSGMAETELQLMVSGEKIADYTPSVTSENISIKEVVTLQNRNYLLIYLDLTGAVPETFDLVFTSGRKKISISYELKERNPQRMNIESFGPSDVLYLIMPDRFANGNPSNDQIPMRTSYKVDRSDPNARHGGDLKGISDRLDYLSDLGVTAIWLNPVLENDMEGGSYHGYATTDYYRVDPRFGSNEEYVQLIEDAHKKGMKVVMDMIFNHCGSDHPWMNEVPSPDWFNNLEEYVQTSHMKEMYFDPYVSEYDKHRMVDGWFVPTMPDLNQRNRHVAKYLIQNSIWWIEYSGVDGIRQDTYPYADYDMMVNWIEAVEKEYPNYNIVGEAWLNNTIGTAFWQRNSPLNKHNTHLKSVMDFRFMGLSHSAFFEETTEWNGGLHGIYDHMTYDFIYPDIYNVLRFLDNHDTDRFLKEYPKDLSGWKQAVTFLLTMPGTPQIYYGTELLMHGNKRRSDGDIRRDVPGGWPDDKTNQFTAEGRDATQNEAFDYLSKLLHWRRDNQIIARGGMKHYVLQKGVYVYERFLGNEKVLIVMNGTSNKVTVNLDRYAESIQGKNSATDFLSGKVVTLGETMTLLPKEVLLLE
ncbi:glycoside hydrolase family 13 protein [Proteiniphilum sp. UBA1028]|jgi:glycosidase|uniref:glycoside hydrolase family 13 protein n=1 Tax=Proteiniphilum sp. UBA1028 TaxID=1947251 RepID=UPI000E866012|nr:glycoside hydrolase family 13 protein [Proteiniphilum sp. UBA1028]HBG58472.1 alpha-amylase [Porphyromonadaceae bacterium]